MKGKKIIILLLIVNLILVGIIYNLINKGNANNMKQIIKGMKEIEYEDYITELNQSHDDYVNYIKESKKKIASALTDMGVNTSNEEKLEIMANNIRSISNNEGPTLLWENPNQTEMFSVGTTITCDLSDYEYILLVTKEHYIDTSSKVRIANCMKVGESKTFYIIGEQNGRTVTFTSTKSSVTKTAVDSSTQSVSSQYGIPVAIYGLNYYIDIGMFAN